MRISSTMPATWWSRTPAKAPTRVYSTINYTLTANVENLVLQGSADLQGYGNESLSNSISGNAGNNILNGGAGGDSMPGGAGNDAYFVDNAGDVVVENPGESADIVYSTVHYGLTANVENLVLQGSADLQGYGNSLNNAIYGNTGNNILNGGAGADAMYGGVGDDPYIVDNAGDSVVENAGEGTDIVFRRSPTAGSQRRNAGPAGRRRLHRQRVGKQPTAIREQSAGRRRGCRRDVRRAGNDVYVVDDAGDHVSERRLGRRCSLFHGQPRPHCEGRNGWCCTGGDLSGTGNTLNNKISAMSATTRWMAAGADCADGGAGNDTYIVDNAGDVVTENAGEGTDTVRQLGQLHADGQGRESGPDRHGCHRRHRQRARQHLTGNSGDNTPGRRRRRRHDEPAAPATTPTSSTTPATWSRKIAGEGTDTVRSSVSYTLTAEVENLVLTGRLTSTAPATRSTTRSPAIAANILDGGAGRRHDGRRGRQRHLHRRQCRRRGDEERRRRHRHGQRSVSYALTAKVENLVLTGTAAIDGTGNALDNALTGNSGGQPPRWRRRRRRAWPAAQATTPTSSTTPATWSLEMPAKAPTRSELGQLHADGQRRESDPDRHGCDRWHRQRARQQPHRQCGGQRCWTAAPAPTR